MFTSSGCAYADRGPTPFDVLKMQAAALQKDFKGVMKRYDCHSGKNRSDPVILFQYHHEKLHSKRKYILI
jgi:hypothetical protein